jgi:radical SAM superfamily enzyme YgiQ (UPF0313 family)
MDRSPLPGGPAAIFVPNVGGQYPVRGGTAGNRARRVFGIQPPIGSFYVASWLQLLGVDVHAFNLELGQAEFEALDAALEGLGNRTYFVFSTSNFYTETEIESIYMLKEKVDRLVPGGAPRLVGAGYSSYFCRDRYLSDTPLDVVVGPHGETSEADMIFSSGYRGPSDTRSSFELFGDLPNLYLRETEDGRETGKRVATRTVALTPAERKVFSAGMNVSLMQLDKKYWSPTNIMDVCAPDDLNIPLELVPNATPATAAQARARSTLHLSNYVHRPNSIKMMTVFGSCPRACQFCQLTKWGEPLYFYTGDEAVDAMNRAVETYPGLEQFIFEDDDFLLRQDHVVDLVAKLRGNRATDGKIFYVSTVPMEIDPELLFDLREVGFRAMLLGLECPVERVARQIGKFKPQYDFTHILEAPKLGHDVGLHIRVTAIPFYPLVAEDDLDGVLDGLLDIMLYGTGISVAVHPLVKAAPGVDLVATGAHEVTKRSYVLPDGSGREVELLGYVLPDSRVVRDVALQAIATAPDEVDAMIEQMGVGEGDYPSSVGVLGLFRATLQAWRKHDGRTVSDETLDRLEARVAQGVEMMARKHEVLSRVQDVLRGKDVWEALKEYTDPETIPYVHLGIRMAADFGSSDEVAAALRLALRLQDRGLRDWRVWDSLNYAAKRPGISSEVGESLPSLERPDRPEVIAAAPKFIGRLSFSPV